MLFLLRLVWSLFLVWSVSGLTFNTSPLSQPDRPAVELPSNFSTRSVQEAFTRAQEIVSSRRSALTGRRRTLNPQQNIPSARHQHFQGIRPRARQSEWEQEIFEEATRVLQKEFNLTPDQIMFGLAETDLREMLQGNEVQNCEAQFNFNCNSSSRYRTYDGTCNNIRNPTWGMASACFERLVDPDYADGIAEKRVARSGNPLPTPRRLSLEIHTHLDRPTDYVTHMFMVFGQFLDHDISLTPFSQEPNDELLECCPVKADDPLQCDPILLGRDDPFFSKFGIDCLSNVRSAKCSTCSLGPRQQINQVTSYIDASQIYGLSQNASAALRNNDGSGTMRLITSTEAGELPPPSAIPNDDFCSFQDPNLDCFETGDQRANQHPALTSMHILFLREHNRIARILREMNRGWDGERIFQETRRIIGAMMQVITYNEFLPLVIGSERVEFFNLLVGQSGRYTQYNDTNQATIFNEFSAAAFRFGHSMINRYFSQISRVSRSRIRLKDNFDWPFGLYRGELEELVRGLSVSAAQKFDRYMVRDVTNHLYQNRGNQTGLDLASLNINRGRDHGIPSYTRLVEFCGGPQIKTWQQLDVRFEKGVRALFQRLYEDVRDIDLFSGGLAERPNQGAVIGPTFTCIVGIQFHQLKYGDRFYFEHGGQAGSFTPAQLNEIKKVTLGKVICQNSGMEEIQPKVMLYATNDKNRVTYCRDLPEMNLRVFSQ